MSTIYGYFAAPNDDTAAEALRQGPIAPVSLPDIDPTVCLATLAEILTGRDYDDLVADDRLGHLVAGDENGLGPMVLAVTDEIRDALAAVTPPTARDAAVTWSTTEELESADPGDLASGIEELADLTRDAAAAGEHLYCRATA